MEPSPIDARGPARSTTSRLPSNGNGNGKPAKLPTIDGRVVDPAEIAAEIEPLSAEEAIAWAIETFHPGLRFATSFQKTSSVIVDIAHAIEPEARFFYLDTELLFDGDLRHPRRARRSLRDRVRALRRDLAGGAGEGSTALTSGAAIQTPAAGSARSSRCARRSKAPSAGSRVSAESTRRPEPAPPSSAGTSASGLWKLNPLADWTDEQVWNHIRENDVPYNPLHDEGYPSIGCTPLHHQARRGRGRSRRPLGRARPHGVRNKWVAPRRLWR